MGTYLTCEENWPGYFVNKGEVTQAQRRIGVSSSSTRYGWADLAGHAEERLDEFSRLDVTPRAGDATYNYRNENNGYGYIVEVDPTRTIPTPAQSNAQRLSVSVTKAALWDPKDADSSKRLATGAKYMDEGTLYVAKFNAGGLGKWLPLTLDAMTKDDKTLAATFARQIPLSILPAPPIWLARHQWTDPNGVWCPLSPAVSI